MERVIQRRRAEASADSASAERRAETSLEDATAAAGDPQADYQDRIAMLERRIEHLEALVEGLQDAVHRQAARQEKEIGALERKTDPAEMARSLGRHARERGL
jgi:TolA-binding protein